MSFICPIDAAGAAGSHTLVHLGLTGFVVVAGSVFLMAAVVAFRRELGRRHRTAPPRLPVRGPS